MQLLRNVNSTNLTADDYKMIILILRFNTIKIVVYFILFYLFLLLRNNIVLEVHVVITANFISIHLTDVYKKKHKKNLSTRKHYSWNKLIV